MLNLLSKLNLLLTKTAKTLNQLKYSSCWLIFISSNFSRWLASEVCCFFHSLVFNTQWIQCLCNITSSFLLPCVFRLTTDQPVMSLLSLLLRSNLRHLVILGARPWQCWVKPTLWAGAKGWLTERNSTCSTELNELQHFHVVNPPKHTPLTPQTQI